MSPFDRELLWLPVQQPQHKLCCHLVSFSRFSAARRQDEQVATVMIAKVRIAAAQIDPSYSSGGDDVHPCLQMVSWTHTSLLPNSISILIKISVCLIQPNETFLSKYLDSSKLICGRWRSTITSIKNEKSRQTKTCDMSRVRRDNPRCPSATWICRCGHTKN